MNTIEGKQAHDIEGYTIYIYSTRYDSCRKAKSDLSANARIRI